MSGWLTNLKRSTITTERDPDLYRRYESSAVRMESAFLDFIKTGTGSEIDGLVLPEEKWEQVDHLRGCYWVKLCKHIQAYKLCVDHDAFPDDPHTFGETFIHIRGSGTWYFDRVPTAINSVGQSLYVPAGVRHYYRAQSDTVMIAIQEEPGFDQG